MKASEESGQLGLAACVRFGKHGFHNWLCGQSLGSPQVKTPPPSIPTPEAAVSAASSPPAAIKPNAAQIALLPAAAVTSQVGRARRITRPELNKSLPERRDQHRLDQKPRRFIPIDVTIDAWG